MNANINELIFSLEKLNPQKINEIRVANKQYANVLKSGVTLGNDTPIDNKGELTIKAEICKESNFEILKKCDEEFPKIKSRIKNYKKLNLLSQIVSAICSATVVTSILTKYEKIEIVGIIFGIIGLITALIPSINEYIITGINNKKINESFEDLIKNRIEIENYNKELTFFIKSGMSELSKISEIINNCNDRTSNITQLLILT